MYIVHVYNETNIRIILQNKEKYLVNIDILNLLTEGNIR